MPAQLDYRLFSTQRMDDSYTSIGPTLAGDSGRSSNYDTAYKMNELTPL